MRGRERERVWVRVRRRVIDSESVDRGTLKIRLAADIDFEGLARSHSRASNIRGSLIVKCVVVKDCQLSVSN